MQQVQVQAPCFRVLVTNPQERDRLIALKLSEDEQQFVAVKLRPAGSRPDAYEVERAMVLLRKAGIVG